MRGIKKDERPYVVARLLPGLSGAARSLILKWDAAKYETDDGVDRLLRGIGKSYLVKQAMPDATQHLDDYHNLWQRSGETTTEFLIREENESTSKPLPS